MKLKEALELAARDADYCAAADGQWAKSFVSALEGSGFVIVPMKATLRMKEWGERELDAHSMDYFDLSGEIYEAMLDARPKLEDAE